MATGEWPRSSLQMFAVSVSRISLFKIAAIFDPKVIVAAYTLGLKVDLFAFMSVFAVGIAVETATGQNLGAKNYHRIFAFHKSAVKQLTILLSILAIIAFLVGEQFALIFTKDPAIIDATVKYLQIACFGYIFFAFGFVNIRVISGAGATMRSMIIVASTLIGVQVPTAYALSHFTPLRETGIWIGVVISYIALTIVGYQQLKAKSWLKTAI